MTLGMAIDAALKRNGKTRSWLANELGVSRSTIARFCSGDATPSRYQSEKLNNILRIQIPRKKQVDFPAPILSNTKLDLVVLVLRQLLILEKTLTKKETSSVELVIDLLGRISGE